MRDDHDDIDPRLYTDRASVQAAAAVIGQEVLRWRATSPGQANSDAGVLLQDSTRALSTALTGYAEAMAAAGSLWRRAESDELRHEAVAAAGRARSRLRKSCSEITASCLASAERIRSETPGLRDSGGVSTDS
ncbi:hypothetical protein [Austwickia chelonae]|uniref:hypothetical protein n=1 Tax=Austwickia chelonae TaxID=100225 RepID=UPI000E26075C|nr:hypothetical protein [Austwickia chelonae]